MSHIWSLIQVTDDFVLIKFDDPILASTLVNASFTLTKDDATPVASVASPFKAINLTKDFLSISRTLYLWWNVSLQGGSTYSLHIANLKHAVTQEILPSDVYTFDTALPIVPSDIERPSRDPVDVEDYSIKTPPVIETSSGPGGTPTLPGDEDTLSIVSITPTPAEAYYLEGSDYEGRIVVEFNQKPAANFINSSDFRLQRRLVTSGIAKWDNVDTVVATDSENPRVNIYLPSDDATPVYSFMVSDDDNYVFWEPGYEYRLIVSKNVGV